MYKLNENIQYTFTYASAFAHAIICEIILLLSLVRHLCSTVVFNSRYLQCITLIVVSTYLFRTIRQTYCFVRSVTEFSSWYSESQYSLLECFFITFHFQFISLVIWWRNEPAPLRGSVMNASDEEVAGVRRTWSASCAQFRRIQKKYSKCILRKALHNHTFILYTY